MINEQKKLKINKFLTEAIGECWHDTEGPQVYSYENCEHFHTCSKCGEHSIQIDFSTWEGFGKLLTWAQEQEWFDNLREWITFEDGSAGNYIQECFIHPDRFANAVYDFLKDKTQ